MPDSQPAVRKRATALSQKITQALDYVETGRTKGKVVIKVR